MQNFYVGIDIGGTSIKGGIIDECGAIVAKNSIKTVADTNMVLQNIIQLVRNLVSSAKIDMNNVKGIGLGMPGMVDSKNGIVVYNNNLKWKNFDIVTPLKTEFKLPIKITNDANAAAYGESKFGASANYSNSIFVTLGTGLGGGIIIDSKLFEGTLGCGAEIGHIIIKKGGLKCTCGNEGCLESYASATAIASRAKKLMREKNNCYLWKCVSGDINKVSAKMVFDHARREDDIKAIVEEFYDYLSIGLITLANVFRPEVFLIGGGLSAQGKKLTDALQLRLDKGLYGGQLGPQVEVLLSSLSNDAGFIGAASLCI